MPNWQLFCINYALFFVELFFLTKIFIYICKAMAGYFATQTIFNH